MTYAGFIDGLFLWFSQFGVLCFLAFDEGGHISFEGRFGINIGFVVVTCAARCDESKEMSEI